MLPTTGCTAWPARLANQDAQAVQTASRRVLPSQPDPVLVVLVINLQHPGVGSALCFNPQSERGDDRLGRMRAADVWSRGRAARRARAGIPWASCRPSPAGRAARAAGGRWLAARPVSSGPPVAASSSSPGAAGASCKGLEASVAGPALAHALIHINAPARLLGRGHICTRQMCMPCLFCYGTRPCAEQGKRRGDPGTARRGGA